MSKKATSIFIIVVTLLLSAFDAYLSWDGIPGNTYSSRIREWGVQMQWLPYAIAGFFGILLTHWFAKRNQDGEMGKKEKIFILFSMLAVAGAGMGVGLFW